MYFFNVFESPKHGILSLSQHLLQTLFCITESPPKKKGGVYLKEIKFATKKHQTTNFHYVEREVSLESAFLHVAH